MGQARFSPLAVVTVARSYARVDLKQKPCQRGEHLHFTS
jgi:hypothetical protein